jgi:hypothetical protein
MGFSRHLLGLAKDQHREQAKIQAVRCPQVERNGLVVDRYRPKLRAPGLRGRSECDLARCSEFGA